MLMAEGSRVKTSLPHAVSPLLTKKQAAEYLGIAERTLDDWRSAKLIPVIERPGFVRFMRSDLEEFVDRHRVAARTVTPYKPRRRRSTAASQ